MTLDLSVVLLLSHSACTVSLLWNTFHSECIFWSITLLDGSTIDWLAAATTGESTITSLADLTFDRWFRSPPEYAILQKSMTEQRFPRNGRNSLILLWIKQNNVLHHLHENRLMFTRVVGVLQPISGLDFSPHFFLGGEQQDRHLRFYIAGEYSVGNALSTSNIPRHAVMILWNWQQRTVDWRRIEISGKWVILQRWSNIFGKRTAIDVDRLFVLVFAYFDTDTVRFNAFL